MIEEVLTRYPVDGFELHLNFWPYYFHPGEIEAGTKIMTDWVGKVYQAVKGSGPDRELAITIPADIDACLSRGMPACRGGWTCESGCGGASSMFWWARRSSVRS